MRNPFKVLVAMSAIAILAAALFGSRSPALSAATPSPVPGGANEVKALSATIGDTVFTGVLRVKIEELRDATPADNPGRLFPNATQRVMVMKSLLHNGLHGTFLGLLSYTLADADGVTVPIPAYDTTGAGLNILQGGAARQTAMFLVDKDFVPVKLIVQCATCGSDMPFAAIRFTVTAANH
jgi:hypothetical protein